MPASTAPLLEVRDLTVAFGSGASASVVVDQVGFDLAEGEVVGIVGESGSGKSVTALAILRLIPSPPGHILSGSIRFAGEDLMTKTRAQMLRTRGRDIAMIFQEPMSSLNPVFTVGQQIGQIVRIHQGLDASKARQRALEMLQQVGIPSPERRIDQYPHEMSGGMRQRVMIAMALSCNPRLLLADEPTTALDVTVQAQILDLLKTLQARRGTGVVFITHDLGIISEFADRVVVMYAGRVVETAPADRIFSAPAHPYTEGLLKSRPGLDGTQRRLPVIKGSVPRPGAWPKGCRFAPRCAYARPACETAIPPSVAVAPGQTAACIRHTDYQFVGVS